MQLNNLKTFQINFDLSVLTQNDQYKSTLNQTLNICAYSRKKSRNFILEMVIGDVEKYSNFELKCPFKKVFFLNR